MRLYMNTSDDSFTYTRHNADGTKETVVGNNNDVYIFIRDKIDLEMAALHFKIDRVESATIKSFILAIGFALAALLWRFL